MSPEEFAKLLNDLGAQVTPVAKEFSISRLKKAIYKWPFFKMFNLNKLKNFNFSSG